jgi:hypothetical protein
MVAVCVSKLHRADFYGWTKDQAAALKRRDPKALDWENLSEQLQSLGKTEARELYKSYVVLPTHLLQWAYQPEKRSRSWRNTIANQRSALRKHLAENSSLKARDAAEFADVCEISRREASTETDMDVEAFPERPPFTAAQAREPEFWPER